MDPYYIPIKFKHYLQRSLSLCGPPVFKGHDDFSTPGFNISTIPQLAV